MTTQSSGRPEAVTCLVDGQNATEIPASDRGLLYGDGVFETMGFWKGCCPLWDRHMARLSRGCRMLAIEMPAADLIAREILHLLGERPRGVIRLTLTRGSGGRAYWPDQTQIPRRVLQFKPWPDDLDRLQREGLSAIICSLRLSIQPALAGLKHCNRLEQVLAAQETQRYGVDEGLLFDQAGGLAEAVSSNLIVRINNRWHAPASPAAVAGVGLDWLRDQAVIDLQNCSLKLADVHQSDAILMINSVRGIRPLKQLNGRSLLIDDDCRQLQRYWNQELIPACDD